MPKWATVWNKTQDERLVGRVRRCESFLCRLRGLTWRRHLPEDEALLLVGHRESRLDAAIHMMCVFFPIAVIWLDRHGTVVDVKLARPFRLLYIPRGPARDILEVHPSLVNRVRVGEQLWVGD